jgi:hypothetical protein
VTALSEYVGLRLTAESLAKVDDLAKRRGTGRSEALRYLLTLGWQSHQAPPEQPDPVKQTRMPVKQAPPVDDPDTFAERHRRLQKPGKR